MKIKKSYQEQEKELLRNINSLEVGINKTNAKVSLFKFKIIKNLQTKELEAEKDQIMQSYLNYNNFSNELIKANQNLTFLLKITINYLFLERN